MCIEVLNTIGEPRLYTVTVEGGIDNGAALRIVAERTIGLTATNTFHLAAPLLIIGDCATLSRCGLTVRDLSHRQSKDGSWKRINYLCVSGAQGVLDERMCEDGSVSGYYFKQTVRIKPVSRMGRLFRWLCSCSGDPMCFFRLGWPEALVLKRASRYWLVQACA